MKFSDGEWLMQPGVSAHYPVEVHDVTATDDMLVIHAATRPVRHRGDTLGGPLLTIRLGVADGRRDQRRHRAFRPARWIGIPGFRCSRRPLPGSRSPMASRRRCSARAGLGVHVRKAGLGAGFQGGGPAVDAQSAAQGMGCLQCAGRGAFVHERLQLGVGECVYGLGERFTAFVKNGQVVENENKDGGTGERAGLQVRALLPDQPRLRRAGEHDRAGLVRSGVGAGFPRAVQPAGREAGIFPHLRPAAQGHPAQAHAADRPAGAAPRVVVRPVAEHLVHDRLRREDLHPVHRGHEGAAAAAACLPLRLLLDARVQLVRF